MCYICQKALWCHIMQPSRILVAAVQIRVSGQFDPIIIVEPCSTKMLLQNMK